MNVVIGCDYSAIELKDLVKKHLTERGYHVIDVGQNHGDPPLIYAEAAGAVAIKVQKGEAERGIVICGTGGGVSIVANKFKGVYCVASEGIFTAYKMAQLNGANVLAMGRHCVGELEAYDMADRFLETNFCDGLSQERTEFVTGLRNRMTEIEQQNFRDCSSN